MKKSLLLSLPLLSVVALAAFTGNGCRRAPAPRDIPVLMYHNVLPDDPGLSVWQVSADEFARQMDQLDEAGFTPILPEDIALAAAGRGTLPDKPVVITFDDGCEGVIRHAEPVLARHGFKAICYVIAGLLAGVGAERTVFDGNPLLSANEAAAMAARGVIAVGSHSMTHARNNPLRLGREIGPSRDAIRQLGGDVHSYCYPFGLHGYDFMYDALRTNGFHTALVCQDEIFRFGTDTNLLAIPRVSVFGGHHDIAFAGADPGRGEVVFSNTGRTLPLRAVVRDPATGREWRSEPRDVGVGKPVAFALPPGALDGPREFEAWDKFGIFRYFP